MPEDERRLLKLFVEGQIGEHRAFRDNVSLARAAGLSETTIRNIRNGHGITQKTFRKIASAFGLKESALQAKLEALDQDQELQSELSALIREEAAKLSEEDQQLILAQIRLFSDLHRRKG